MVDSTQNLLRDVLLKPQKTDDDVEFIYEKIRNLQFFSNFFAQNLRTSNPTHIMDLCGGLGYEHFSAGDFVFHKGDLSNNKFYVILSGQVGVVKPYQADELPSEESEPSNTFTSQGRRSFKASTTLIQDPILHKTASPSKFSKERSTIIVDESDPNSPVGKTKTSTTEVQSTNSESAAEVPNDANRSRSKTMVISNTTRQPFTLSLKRKLKMLMAFTLPKYNGENFEEYAKKHGKLFCCLKEGDSFGELALKTNAPRAMSILCKTDCQLLTVTKHQFNLLFLKKEFEKETFLLEVFPFVSTLISSSSIFNDFLYSFQTELYAKGSYLTIEGRGAESKDDKIFIIYQGECLVEKTISRGGEEYLETSKSPAETQTIRLAIVGRGTIVGEEILVNKGPYAYSVKALSENVIVYSISKKLFKTLYFKDFHHHIKEVYQKKKAQRDLVIESSQKDLDLSPRKSILGSSLLIKSAQKRRNTVFTFTEPSRKLSNEIPFLNSSDARKLSLILNTPKSSPMKSSEETSPTHSPVKSQFKMELTAKAESPLLEGQHSSREAKGMVKAVDLQNPKKKKVAAKLEYLTQITQPVQNINRRPQNTNIESIRLFDTNSPKSHHALKLKKVKSNDPNLSALSNFSPPTSKKRDDLRHITQILQEVAKSTRSLKIQNSQMSNIKEDPKPNVLNNIKNLSPIVQSKKSLLSISHLALQSPKSKEVLSKSKMDFSVRIDSQSNEKLAPVQKPIQIKIIEPQKDNNTPELYVDGNLSLIPQFKFLDISVIDKLSQGPDTPKRANVQPPNTGSNNIGRTRWFLGGLNIETEESDSSLSPPLSTTKKERRSSSFNNKKLLKSIHISGADCLPSSCKNMSGPKLINKRL